METIFGLSTLLAVVLLGALISLGNERQRRALDGIRQQAANWAAEDLRLKRGKLAREVRVEDPRIWLDVVVNRVLGISPRLVQLTTHQQSEAQVLVGVCDDRQRLLLSPLPKRALVRALYDRRKQKGRLGKMSVGLLGDRPRRVPVYELTIVNAGVFFDLEAETVWQDLFGAPLGTDRLYLYLAPAPGDKQK
jgi:hypothetical protein